MEEIGLSLVKKLELEQELKREETHLLKHLHSMEIEIFKRNNVMVCGGAITSIFSSAEINDIDCYFRSVDDYEKTYRELKDATCSPRCKTDNAATLTNFNNKSIQLICLPQYIKNTPEEVYTQFDFSINEGAYDFKTMTFSLSDRFLKHIAQRQLVFNINASSPINSMLRVDKYEKRGYTISKTEFFKVILSLTRVKLNTFNDLVGQLRAVSTSTHGRLRQKIKDQDLGHKEFDIYKLMSLLEECEADYLRDLSAPQSFEAKSISKGSVSLPF